MLSLRLIPNSSTRMSDALQFVSIIATDSVVGKRLAKFTPLGLQTLCADFKRRFAVEVEIDLCDEDPGVHGELWLDFPRYEITFRVQRLAHIRAFEQLAFDTGTPEPEK